MDFPKGRAPRVESPLLPASPGSRSDAGLFEGGGDVHVRRSGASLDSDDFGINLRHETRYRAFLQLLQDTNAASETQSAVLSRPMDDTRREVLAFLNAAMDETGLKPGGLAKKAGLSPTTITRFLKDPENFFVPKATTLRKIASVTKVALPDIVNATASMDMAPVRGSIPVLGTVRAGSWEKIPDEPVVEEWLPMEVPEYAGANLFALRVDGRSMDEFYPDGTYVICAHPSEAALQVGDHVVCRQGDGTGKYETTLKEMELLADGTYQLTPRSSDTSIKPIPLRRDEDSDEGVAIIGIVLVQYAHRKRGRGPIVSL